MTSEQEIELIGAAIAADDGAPPWDWIKTQPKIVAMFRAQAGRVQAALRQMQAAPIDHSAHATSREEAEKRIMGLGLNYSMAVQRGIWEVLDDFAAEVRNAAPLRQTQAASGEPSNSNTGEFIFELSNLCRKYGFGLNNASLFIMERDDYSNDYELDKDCVLTLGKMTDVDKRGPNPDPAASGDVDATAKRLYNHIIKLEKDDTVQSDKDAIAAILAYGRAEAERARLAERERIMNTLETDFGPELSKRLFSALRNPPAPEKTT